MAVILSKEIYESLRCMGTVENTEQFSEMLGRSKSYARSNWARHEDVPLSAYTALYFSLDRIFCDTTDAMTASHGDEKATLQNGLDELETIMGSVWDRMSELAPN